MQLWLAEAKNVLQGLQDYTASRPELVVVAGVAVVVFLLMMKIAGTALQNPNADIPGNLMVLVIGAAILLAAVVAVRLYVLPHVGQPETARWLVPATLGVVLLLLVTPLLAALQRIRYLAALLMLIVALGLAGAAALLARGGYRAVVREKTNFGNAKQHAESINDFLRK